MKFISCQDASSLRFVWEIEASCFNMQKLGFKEEYHILWYVPFQGFIHPYTKRLEKKLENTQFKFFYYEGNEQIEQDIARSDYIPLNRPYCLAKHFEKYPELSSDVWMYIDSDILFTRWIDLSKYENDNVCHLSFTGRREQENNNYLNYHYLDSKIEQALAPDVLRALDPIGVMAKKCGITKQDILSNDGGVGGAQSILKGIDSQFWWDVYNNSLEIKTYLASLNQTHFKGATYIERENNGWQSWCADMLALLYAIWKRGIKTECPEELDFCWASDKLESIRQYAIMHNAGIGSDFITEGDTQYRVFNKNAYNRRSPYDDLENLVAVSNKYCSFYYVANLLHINDSIFTNN